MLFEQYLNNSQFPVGAQETFQIPEQTQYEDIAGLQPLPLQRMLKQIGRPLNKLYEQLAESKGVLYEGLIKKEIKEKLKPNPERTQAILKRAQAVENTRQTWDPIEAEWKERENRANPNPKSKPSQASFDTFSDVVRTVSKNTYRYLVHEVPNHYGILGDISDYLTPNQLNIIKQGVREQLEQGVNPKLVRGAIGGNARTGRGHIEKAVKNSTQDWLNSYMRQTDPPLIVPGVQHQFEGV